MITSYSLYYSPFMLEGTTICSYPVLFKHTIFFKKKKKYEVKIFSLELFTMHSTIYCNNYYFKSLFYNLETISKVYQSTYTMSSKYHVHQKETLPFAIKHLPDVFREKAEEELNETKENIVHGLQQLKNMTRGNKTTCGLDFIDDFLVQFLRQRKYDVDKAFKKLVNFVQFRNNYGYIFGSVDIDKYFLHPSGKFCTILPNRCPDGCTIILIEVGKWDPEKLPIEDFRRLVVTLFSQSLRDPMTQINGFKEVWDFAGTGFKHLKYCTPHHMYLFYYGGLDCFPGRYREIHLVNNSLALKTSWTLIRGFISQKMKRRIFFHPTPQDVLEFLPSSILPVQYGGVLKDYHMTEWLKYANEQQGKFPLSGQHNYY